MITRLLLVSALLCALAGCSTFHRGPKPDANGVFPDGTSTISQAAAQFGAEQNDTEGYDGRAWGSAPSPNSIQGGIDQEADAPLSDIVNKVVGCPGEARRYGQYLGDSNGELLFGCDDGDDRPKLEYSADEQTDTYFIYFDGRLALVATRLKGDSAQVDSDLSRKYSPIREIAADSWGDGSNEAVASHGSRVDGIFIGKLYKRGATNTRIYLLQHVVNGFPDGLYLAYMPNVYFSAIHDEWPANYQRAVQAESQQAAKQREQVQQADQQKIQ